MWFVQRNPIFWVEDSIGICGWRRGKLVAGAVCDNRIKNSAAVHIVIEDPIVLKHGFFEAMFNMAFGHEREYVFANVASDNLKVQKLAKHVGFKEMIRLPDALEKGRDMVVLRLERGDCKYLGD